MKKDEKKKQSVKSWPVTPQTHVIYNGCVLNDSYVSLTSVGFFFLYFTFISLMFIKKSIKWKELKKNNVNYDVVKNKLSINFYNIKKEMKKSLISPE